MVSVATQQIVLRCGDLTNSQSLLLIFQSPASYCTPSPPTSFTSTCRLAQPSPPVWGTGSHVVACPHPLLTVWHVRFQLGWAML